MRVTAAQVAGQLAALQPPGRALPVEPDSLFGRVLEGLAAVLARVNNRAVDLREEADPRTTLELLTDWERVAGLPDDCLPLAETIQARRDTLVSKLTTLGGQSPQYFVDLLAGLGFTVTVEEFRPFRVGHSAAGDILAGEDWQFAWRVTHADSSRIFFRAGQSAVGEPLVSFGNASIACIVAKGKPAHTSVLLASPQLRRTEDGEYRHTEAGDIRIEELLF